MNAVETIRRALDERREIGVIDRASGQYMTAKNYALPFGYNPAQVTSMATLGLGEHPKDINRVVCSWEDEAGRYRSDIFNIHDLNV